VLRAGGAKLQPMELPDPPTRSVSFSPPKRQQRSTI
jgi:hypothetical protein